MSVNVISALQHSISLCFVYAPEDAFLKQELENLLSPLVRSGLISLWSFDKIVPGNKFVGEIEHHFDMTQIILDLIRTWKVLQQVGNPYKKGHIIYTYKTNTFL